MTTKRIIRLLLLGVFVTCQAASAKTVEKVHLKGQLKHMGTVNVPMTYDGASSMLGDSRTIFLHTDSEGRFDTILSVKEPMYYNISRNTLFLSPGDDLTVSITPLNQEAHFTGKGAEANEYMKDRLFPHGGSYLNGGQGIQYDFKATKSYIDSLASIREKQLEALPNVSADFKSMEKARITADRLISYLYYPIYASMMAGNRKNISFAVNNVDSFYTALTDEAHMLMQEINDDKNLNVAAVRSVLSNVLPEKGPIRHWADGIQYSQRTQELMQAEDWVYKLRQQVSAELLAGAEAFVGQMKNKDFISEMRYKISQVGKLLKGPAVDIQFTDVNGNSHNLSEFKGKVIYIDFWATWCGPCIKESPLFESLSEKFKGKDVVFLPISTDTSRKTWLNYLSSKQKKLTQYNSVDTKLKEGWAIFYIPRFVLIDKDFNISNAYAPKPSEAGIEEAINALL